MLELLIGNKNYGYGTIPGTTNLNTPIGGTKTSGNLTVGVRYSVTVAGSGANFSTSGGPNPAVLGDEWVATNVTVDAWGGSTVVPLYALAEGAVAILTDKGVVLDTSDAGNLLDDCKYVKLAVGRGYGVAPQITKPLPRGKVKVDFDAYDVPVKEVKFIGAETTGSPVGSFVIPSTLVPSGDDPLIYDAVVIIEKTNELYPVGNPKRRRDYRIPITTTIANMANADAERAIINALIAKINNDPLSMVTAVAVGSAGAEVGIQLTAKNFYESFNVSVDGVIRYSTIVDVNTTGVSTEPKAMYSGKGTCEQVLALEMKANAESGNTDGMTPSRYPQNWNTWKEISKVKSGAGYGYALVALSLSDIEPGGIGELGRRSITKPQVKVAVEGTVAAGTWTIVDSIDVLTSLDTLLAMIFGSAGVVTATQEIETGADIV